MHRRRKMQNSTFHRFFTVQNSKSFLTVLPTSKLGPKYLWGRSIINLNGSLSKDYMYDRQLNILHSFLGVTSCRIGVLQPQHFQEMWDSPPRIPQQACLLHKQHDGCGEFCLLKSTHLSKLWNWEISLLQSKRDKAKYEPLWVKFLLHSCLLRNSPSTQVKLLN